MRPVTGVLLAAALAAGCGDGNKPKLVAVTGRVAHKGQPLTAGSITFHPTGGGYAGDRPSCLLQLDGSFVMRTYPYGDGVPPGSYKVTLSNDLAARIGRPLLADSAKTPLQIDVPDGGVEGHTFEVK